MSVWQHSPLPLTFVYHLAPFPDGDNTFILSLTMFQAMFLVLSLCQLF